VDAKAGSTETAPADYQSAGDAELLAAAARRDDRAYGEIVRRYYQPVYRLTWRLTGGHADTEDIAQEAFLRLWRDPSQLREAGALKGWLLRVASNAVIDHARRRGKVDSGELPDVADERDGPDSGIDRSRAARIVDSRIADLPERQRLALSLVHFEGLSNIDAASIMDISVEALESLLARARRSLRQSLQSEWRDLLAVLGDQP
jgi:RNA polymerase sigma-70 factor (ECF subfamily)